MATKKTSPKDIITKLESQEKNTATVQVTVSAAKVTSIRQETLNTLTKDITIKGFRKGKAPVEIVEKQLDPGKVQQRTIEALLPLILDEVLKEFKFNLITSPRVSLGSAEGGKDWTFTLQVPLMPEFDLGDFKATIKGAKAASELWTPEKGEAKKDKPQAEEERLQKIFDALLAAYKFDVPDALIEDEVNRSLTRLVQQTETLGLKIEDYLQSIGKSGEELRHEYFHAAEDSLRLEIVLSKLGTAMAIDVPEAEIDQLIQATGDDKTKAALQTPSQRLYIADMLRKRKTIDALLKL